MKIARTEVIPVRIPLKKPAKSAHGLISTQESVVVKILTDRGEHGLGGIDPIPGYDPESQDEVVTTIESSLAPLIKGKDPFQIKKILEIMDLEIAGHLGSKAAVEMALFDLMGKCLGVPVHVFFGGRVKDYIHLNGWIGIVDPEQASQEARGWLDKGFLSVKVKIDTDLTAAKKRVEAVRAEGKDKLQIRVDANESLDMERALDTVKALAPLNIFYLEQPFPRKLIKDFVTLSRSSPIKLMADESVQDMETLTSILKLEAAHFVKVKVQKQGGFLKINQMIQVAEGFGIPVILGHGFGLTISTLAELHIAASTKAVLDGCESVGPIKMADDIVKEPIIMDRGSIRVPTKPGLGVELDEKKVKKYRVN